MVQVIDTLHPEPLEAKPLALAMAHGSLELVQWIAERRLDHGCCALEPSHLCRACTNLAVQSVGDADRFQVGSWLLTEGLINITNKSGTLTDELLRLLSKNAELVRWYDARESLSKSLSKTLADALFWRTIYDANDASEEIVAYFLEKGYTPPRPHSIVDALIKASCSRGRQSLLELVLERVIPVTWRHHFVYATTHPGGEKVLQWSEEYGQQRPRSCRDLMTNASMQLDHFDTIKWLVEARGVKSFPSPSSAGTDHDALELAKYFQSVEAENWFQNMDNAASAGYLELVKWLHESGRSCSTRAMDQAAACGHLKVVQWLHENRSEGCTPDAMNHAAWEGRLDTVEWLYENLADGDVTAATVFAAANGNMEVVQWCLDHGGCARCAYAHLLAGPTVMDCEDPNPRFLYTLQLLRSHRDSTPIACIGKCTYGVVSGHSRNLALYALNWGDLLLLEYLHEHHADQFKWGGFEEEGDEEFGLDDMMHTVIYEILASCHEGAIQWLRTHYPDRVYWDCLLERAEKMNHSWVMAWP